MSKKRCAWPSDDELMLTYHDEEWGVPLYDDQKLFEFMVLDAFQAGLSWRTVLHKRENFRKAFDNFNAKKIARYNTKDVKRLMADKSIIRNRQKIEATITNAQKFLDVQEEEGSFADYIWQFVGGEPKVNTWERSSQIPASTKESEAMSNNLKERGFKFVGPTICYAFMQAAGMVNDHVVTCFRYKELTKQ